MQKPVPEWLDYLHREEANGYSVKCTGYSYEDVEEHLEVKSKLVIAQRIAGWPLKEQKL